jgi:hypothetical protein
VPTHSDLDATQGAAPADPHSAGSPASRFAESIETDREIQDDMKGIPTMLARFSMLRPDWSRLLRAVGATLGLAVVLGCGDDTGLGKRYPVSGSVTYKGEPVKAGRITFIPASKENQREASGTIQDGSYKLTTASPDDGALPGEYKVTVVSQQVDDTKVVETITKYGGGGRQQDIAKAQAKAKNLIPAKYQLADTSDLKATVAEHSNTLDFNLTD